MSSCKTKQTALNCCKPLSQACMNFCRSSSAGSSMRRVPLGAVLFENMYTNKVQELYFTFHQPSLRLTAEASTTSLTKVKVETGSGGKQNSLSIFFKNRDSNIVCALRCKRISCILLSPELPRPVCVSLLETAAVRPRQESWSHLHPGL